MYLFLLHNLIDNSSHIFRLIFESTLINAVRCYIDKQLPDSDCLNYSTCILLNLHNCLLLIKDKLDFLFPLAL